MNRHHARLLALGIVTSGWVGSAFGQAHSNAQGQGPGGPRPTTAGDGRQQPPKPINNDAADRATAGMRSHGSSLLKATMHARQDPGQARLADLSFSAVPEPIPRTLRKHDQVTIVVREESDVRSKGTTELKKEAEFEARLEEWIALRVHNVEIEGGAQGPNPPAIRATGKRNFKGEGEVDRSDRFVTRIQAEVVDVKPNGTLVLQARSRIRTDDEDRYFVLTGTCRVEDVSADNTILSSQLYDKDLVQRNKGGIRNTTKRGWLGNLLDAITPF
jgi:flagellar L-ring protein precursor FlgH